MASRVLYPPIIDSHLPAFQAGDQSYCRVFFSLSKFNSSDDVKSLHVSIVKQDTNMNVVKLVDDQNADNESNNRLYRSTGIILNMKFNPVLGEDNLYYFDIYNRNLSSEVGGYKGWIPGWKYKIQIRLSAKDYASTSQEANSAEELKGQSAWLNENSSEFSEWSTVCVTKAIGRINLLIPSLDYDSTDKEASNSNDITKTLYFSTLDFFGSIDSVDDSSEVLYKYNLKLYDNEDNLLEDSGDLFANNYQNINSFKYLIKYEFKDNHVYSIIFTYTTNNDFTQVYKTTFNISLIQIDRINCTIVTVENDVDGILKDKTSIEEEEEEGRLAFKIQSTSENPYNGNICIRRASSKTNFKEWIDIKIIVVRNEIISSLPIYYDYSIESGVWYKYGIQSIDKNGTRGILIQTSAIMRNFEYSYLLGENNQQLKLKFNNTMGNYKIQLMDNKTEPLGNRYPIIARNAALRYQIFPINGLISFWMDENNLFCDKKVIYKEEDIIDLYNKYNKDNNIKQYDYIYERDFRKLVLDFLHDGKPKLFKSPTEGNVIVRLTDINCIPTQSLDRMLYEFSATGNEIAENTNENYLKYGFLNPGQWSSEFATYEIKIGQLQMDFTPNMNIFQEIYKKYDSQGKNLGGYTKSLGEISHIKITIEDKPFRIENSAGEIILGNNFLLDNKKITIYDPRGIYEFDSRLSYTKRNVLNLLTDAEGKFESVKATIDFLYQIRSEIYEAKQYKTREVRIGIGQLFGEYKPNTSLYNEIYYKYYIEWTNDFRRLNTLSSIEIEANPGTLFYIEDMSDPERSGDQHEINDTGILRLYELNDIREIKYIGIRNQFTGDIDTNTPTNILLNYKYSILKGTYKGEEE